MFMKNITIKSVLIIPLCVLFLISVGYNCWQIEQTQKLENQLNDCEVENSEWEEKMTVVQNKLDECLEEKTNIDEKSSYNNINLESDRNDLIRKNRDLESIVSDLERKVSDLEYKLR